MPQHFQQQFQGDSLYLKEEDEHELRLRNELQSSSGDLVPSGDEQAALLQDLMGIQQMDPEDPMANQLLQLLARQQEQTGQGLAPESAGPVAPSRPVEHYLTIAQNGT